MDNILTYTGSKFLKEKITVNLEDGTQETIRLYASEPMLDILEDRNYSHFFLDGTFKCVPKGFTLFIYNKSINQYNI